MSVVIYYYWEAMLVSYLAARIIVLPFTGIETLMADSEYLIAVWPGTYSQAVFESSIDPVWQKAWNERMKPYMEDYIPYAGKNLHIYQGSHLPLHCQNRPYLLAFLCQNLPTFSAFSISIS